MHNCHIGNEEAELLANQAANTQQDHQIVSIADNLVKNYKKDKFIEHWHQTWKMNPDKYKHTEGFFHTWMRK